MKRTLLVIALLAPAARGVAQNKPAASLPVIMPKVTELGTVADIRAPWDAALSPRGSVMAYTTNGGLYLWNATTQSNTVLVKGETEGVVWSPAGDAIAFARTADQGSREFIWSQRIDPATGKAVGTAQRVSLSSTTGRSPQYSRDGKFIAFARADGRQRASLVVVPAAGGAERALASGFDVRKMRWSDDGATIYYIAYPDSAWSKTLLNRVAVTGGAPQLVRAFPRNDEAPPQVTTDVRLVAIPARRTADQNFSTLADLTGKSLATLTYAPDLWVGEWAGTHTLSAVRETHPRGLSVADVSNGTSRVLIDTTAEVGAPDWYPDGSHVAVIVMQKGVPALVTIGVDGTGLRKIPLSALPEFGGVLNGWDNAELHVSPDGRYAMYLGRGRQSLELVDLASGRQRTLTRSTITVTTPVWRRDSRSIRYVRDGAVFQSNNTRAVHEVSLDGADKVVRMFPFSEFPGAATVLVDENTVSAFGHGSVNNMRVPLDGGPPRVTVSATVMGPGVVSPDGRTLALRLGPAAVRDAKPARQITLVSLVDLSLRTINLPFTDVTGMYYHPDGHHIWIGGRESPTEPIVVYSVPLDGTAPKSLLRVETKEPIPLFAVSPNARYIAYTVAATSHLTFLSLDYSDGISRLFPAKAKR